jgi:hypothetical protein
MSISVYDIVFVADTRFEGGSSTALATEMKAAARAGYDSALLMVKGPIIGLPLAVHAEIRASLDGAIAARIDPRQKVETRLLLIHHPGILMNPLQPRPAIEAEQVVLVLHHPARDQAGTVQYDLRRVVQNCVAAFGKPVLLAPVSAVVRASLPRQLPDGCDVMAEDWHNLIDIDDWPERQTRSLVPPIRIGRHSRAHIQKWPDTLQDAKAAYPTEGKRYENRMLGGEDFLRAHYGEIPASWTLLPFEQDGVADFLRGLDFYVYYHSDAWSEAFGRCILEALAVGLVTILPQHFQPIFGDAALYATPGEVKDLVERYVADAELYAGQSRRARRFAETQHGHDHFLQRIEALLTQKGTHATRQPQSARPFMPPLPVRKILFISSNGIGMGHLTQQMAIAERLPADLVPVFATMSYALKVAVDAGYQTHFLTHHRAMDADPRDWGVVFAEELFELVRHLRPSVIAYDATPVYPAVAEVLALFPDIYSIWVRRPMWRDVHRKFLEHHHAFDTVIERGELADEFDLGPTKALQKRTYVVPPVLHVDPSTRLDKDAARRMLDLPTDGTAVALQLGSGSNFDMSDARAAAIEAVLARNDSYVVELRSPIRGGNDAVEATHERHLVRDAYPAFRYSRAFDAAISAAGYNSFHEHVLGALPTLFVPNEAPEMDMQLNRARWAELNGYGWTMRRDTDLPACRDLVERLLDPWERTRVETRCRSIPWQNGANHIASFIADHARLVRSDRKAVEPE